MKKDNPKNYWFKRRRFGWGWIPVSWQGWVTVIAFALVLIGAGLILLQDAPRNELSSEVIIYLVIAVLAVLALLNISLKKGPSPKWRMGKSPEDNPDEDY